MMLSIATSTLLQQHVLDYSSNVSTNILIYCGSYTSGLISHVTVVVLGVRTLDLLAMQIRPRAACRIYFCAVCTIYSA